MILKIRAFWLLLILSSALNGQDTLTFMQYNLLMYGDDFGGCNQNNNNIDDKNNYLHTIVEYVKPDILTVNEIDEDIYYSTYLLNGALNINGTTYFKMGTPPNVSNGYTVNQIYYNSEKLTLYSQGVISTNVRDIDIFKLYHITPSNDTVYFNCCVAHLKAGQGYEDERAAEIQKLMNYLDTPGKDGNYFVMGDFNVYTSAEPAFQKLINYSNQDIRFYDPANKTGAWNNNDYFSSVHTQSTHTSSGCFSGGGMDDRFDFIMVSEELLSGEYKAKYVSGSYRTIGQDGKHFNKSLLDYPQNTTVPQNVLNALYNMSDHLPVSLKIAVGGNVGFPDYEKDKITVEYKNPVREKLVLKFKNLKKDTYIIELFNSFGKKIFSTSIARQIGETFTIPLSNVANGIYILTVTSTDGKMTTGKIIKRM